MSINEQLDFSTLVWVKNELDETLDRARQALEDYVENPEDVNQLQFCATYLHQVQGTLKMVELYGAAMVAEEMELVAKKLLEGEASNPEDAFNVLMRGIVQLPDYLERIQLGHKDIPIVLLPLVNDLRTVRGDQLLSESALFNPDLSLGMPDEARKTQIKLSPNQLKPIINKIRNAYQQALLGWFKGDAYQPQHDVLRNILGKLQMLMEHKDLAQLLWVADGAYDALNAEAIKDSVTFRRLAGRLDLLLRKIGQTDNLDDLREAAQSLTKNLLYYVAMATDVPEKARLIKEYFNLDQFVADDEELAHAQSSISGKNKELLETVAGAIRDDVLSAQESLDLFMRHPEATVDDLNPIQQSLGAIADTLGILGLGSARQAIVEQSEKLRRSVESGQRPDDEQLMNMAKELLRIEAELNDHIQSLGFVADDEKKGRQGMDIPRSEVQEILETLSKESIHNLNTIKSNFVSFIETTWDKDKIRDNPRLLNEIKGALQMLNLEDAAHEVGRIAEYTEYLLKTSVTPSANDLDMLADAVASIEYYLEYLGSNSPGRAKVLSLAQSNLDKLFEQRKEIDETAVADSIVQDDIESADHSDDPKELAEGRSADTTGHTEPVTVDELEGGVDDKSLQETDIGDQKPESSPDTADAASLILSFDEDIDPEIREVFLEEFAEELQHIEDIYPTWRIDPEANTETLSEIRRIFHTLKGSGRLVGCEAVGDFGWRVENMCNQVLDGVIEPDERFLAVLDAAKGIMPDLLEGLKQNKPVPETYFLVLESAEQVANGSEEVSLLSQVTVVNDAPKAEGEPGDHVVSEQSDMLDFDFADSSDEPVAASEPDVSGESVTDETVGDFVLGDISFDMDSQSEPEESPEPEVSEVSSELGVDPVFVEILQQEVDAHLNEIDQYLALAEENTPAAISDDLIRTVHTLNGAASMANVESIVCMTSPLEQVLKLKNQAGEPLEAPLLESIKAFVSLSRSIMQNLEQEHMVEAQRIGSHFEELSHGLEPQAEGQEHASVDTPEEDSSPQLLDDTVLNETMDAIAEESETAAADADSAAEMAQEALSEIQATTPEDKGSALDDLTFVFDHADTEEVGEAEEAEEAEARATAVPDDDAMDAELMGIFAEEMQEILDSCENIMAQLESEPGSSEHVTALQRELHTLKGGARMAGLNAIGDLSHAMESVFETVAETGGEINPHHYAVLSRSFDKLHALLQTGDYGLFADVSEDVKVLSNLLESEGAELRAESRLDTMAQQADTSVTAESAQPMAAGGSSLASGGQLKVPSALLDNLVNHAGEISIYTSRLEQQTGNTRFNLEELANTVTRLREQLRKLEIETETQIISTYQREAENFDEGFDPLELDRFSTLQQLSRSLSESVSDLTNIQSYLIDITTESENLLKYQSRANTELQEGLMKTRMVAFSSLLPRLRRLIRTTADELGKQARLDVRGGDGEMDKTVLEGIQAPLEHIFRNALAHGIESPDQRVQAGKPETGQIVLDMQREATEVVITISDDGRGIDREKVRQIAIEKGIISPDARLKDKDIDQLILHSGFSTVETVSKLAGRGVGMDVVDNEVKKLGGMLEIESEPGKGTTFRIRLPYTLALTHAILVRVGETQFALPVSGVEGVVRMSWEEYQRRVENNELEYEYAGQTYRIQDLNQLLDSNADPVVEDNQVPLVMVRSGNEGVALRVDKVLGSREIVVKTVGTQIASVPGIYGATILGDGTVVLILDVIPLARSWQRRRLAQTEDDMLDVAEEETRRVPTIMIVDDSITMRKVGQRVLQRNGFEVLTAKDGFDASEQLEEVLPDLMLLDIEMPRMDGYELAGLMQKDERLSQVPIIMITSRTGAKHRQKAMELGVKRYLGKPYQEFELIKNIKELLNIEDDES